MHSTRRALRRGGRIWRSLILAKLYIYLLVSGALFIGRGSARHAGTTICCQKCGNMKLQLYLNKYIWVVQLVERSSRPLSCPPKVQAEIAIFSFSTSVWRRTICSMENNEENSSNSDLGEVLRLAIDFSSEHSERNWNWQTISNNKNVSLAEVFNCWSWWVLKLLSIMLESFSCRKPLTYSDQFPLPSQSFNRILLNLQQHHWITSHSWISNIIKRVTRASYLLCQNIKSLIRAHFQALFPWICWKISLI